jgi:hypothetical protein
MAMTKGQLRRARVEARQPRNADHQGFKLANCIVCNRPVMPGTGEFWRCADNCGASGWLHWDCKECEEE